MKRNFKGKHGPLLIAEIGGNHEGDFEYAKRLTQLAIESDVDFIKFQIYTGDSLVSSVESPQRNAHFKKFELSQDQHLELAKMVQDAGIGYMSSVWNKDALAWIDHAIPIYKIGSGDLTAYPVLRETAKKGKPMIISTGLSTEEEVLQSVKYIQLQNPIYNDPDQLAVLQCTSMYPIPKEDANLSVMTTLKRKTGLTIGYSDHTEGSQALVTSVIMGAEILEFHFTDSREGKQFRDHKVSLTRDEVLEMIVGIKEIQALQGNPVKKPVQIEIDNNHVETFRRAVYPSRDIKKGETITEDMLVTLRPNVGIDARSYFDLIGKTAKVDLQKHGRLSFENFQ